MCDYCNNEKSIISIEDTYEDGYTGIDRYENGDVYINGNELNLSCDVEVTYVSKSSKINYCPMCGRKLTEEINNARKIIKFKGDISDFKVKDGVVKIQLAADTQDVVLDQLNEISKGPLMINLEASQTELLPEEANKNANS